MRTLTTCLAVGLLASLAACSNDSADTTTSKAYTVTVTHPEVEAPTVIDLGDEGPSVGDVRLFHFDATADDGSVVSTDWVMTTTAVDTPEPGVQVRMVTGVFSFGNDGDQLILEGVALYPGESATLKVSSTTIRSLIGGSGKYEGASGWVESIHHDDGTWEHIFHID
ncbi:hypothetical protein BH10ACT2_BH10ACT2_14490 [soil metagenome]